MILVWIFIDYLYFSKKKVFPNWYIGIIVFSLAFVIIDTLVIHFAFPDAGAFSTDTIMNIARSMTAALIWIPYMLVSRRVKATFVK